MAKEVGSGRDNEQCRSHHLTMMKLFKNPEEIIVSIMKKSTKLEAESTDLEVKIECKIEEDQFWVFSFWIPHL